MDYRIREFADTPSVNVAEQQRLAAVRRQEQFDLERRTQDAINQRTQRLVDECERQYIDCIRNERALRLWQTPLLVGRASLMVLLALLLFIAIGPGLRALDMAPAAKDAPALYSFLGAIAVFMVVRWIDGGLVVGKGPAAAAEFANVADRFRVAANVRARDTFAAFSAEFEALMKRMEEVRATAPWTPAWCMQQAVPPRIGPDDFKPVVDAAEPRPATAASVEAAPTKAPGRTAQSKAAPLDGPPLGLPSRPSLRR